MRPVAFDSWTPCTRSLTAAAISRAIATPSATAASRRLDRAHPAQELVGHAHAGHFVRQELGVQLAVERPQPGDDRHLQVLDPPQERVEGVEVEDELGDRELGAGLDLELEAPDLLVEVERRRVDRDTDVVGGLPRSAARRRCPRRGSAG